MLYNSQVRYRLWLHAKPFADAQHRKAAEENTKTNIRESTSDRLQNIGRQKEGRI